MEERVVPAEEKKKQWAYLLFCVSACARPLGDDILPSLVVGGKGKCDTGKGGAKVDSDDELCLVAICRLDLDGRVAVLGLLAQRWGEVPERLLRRLHAVARRRVHRLRWVAGVLHGGTGVERGGVLGQLTGNHGTGGSP